MKKIVINLLMILTMLFTINIMVSSSVFAQDVWVFTDKNKTEYYVRTESVVFVKHIKPEFVWYYLEVKVMSNYADGYKTDDYYRFNYDENTGKWDCKSWGKDYLQTDPKYRAVFDEAMKYANRTETRTW